MEPLCDIYVVIASSISKLHGCIVTNKISHKYHIMYTPSALVHRSWMIFLSIVYQPSDGISNKANKANLDALCLRE